MLKVTEGDQLKVFQSEHTLFPFLVRWCVPTRKPVSGFRMLSLLSPLDFGLDTSGQDPHSYLHLRVRHRGLRFGELFDRFRTRTPTQMGPNGKGLCERFYLTMKDYVCFRDPCF